MDRRNGSNRQGFRRKCIQLVSALLYNANLSGFASGSIYKGQTKGLCVPGLNCYSCPGAVASCPLGALQNALSAMPNKLPLYIAGALLLMGLALGRLICGFLCPFGLIQELLHKIPRTENQKRAVEPPPVLAEIRRAGGIRGGPAPVVRLRPGPAGARLLQVHLPGGDPGGGPPPGGPPAGVPGPGGVAVHLEGGPVRRHPPGVRLPVPGLLPLPVPPGGHLLPLLPGGPAGLPGGRREVRRLRPVRAPVPHGRGAGGGPGVYPVRQLPPNLPQRGHLFRLGKEQIP